MFEEHPLTGKRLEKKELKGLLTMDGQSVLSYSLAYVQLLEENESMLRRINLFLAAVVQNKAQRIDAYMKKDLQTINRHKELYPTIINSTVHVPYNREGLLSVVTSYLIQTSPVDFGLSRESFTFDFVQKELVTLSCALSMVHLRAEEAIFLIAKQIREQMLSGSACFYDDWAMRLVKAFSYASFFFTPHAVAVYFPSGLIGQGNFPHTFYLDVDASYLTAQHQA